MKTQYNFLNFLLIGTCFIFIFFGCQKISYYKEASNPKDVQKIADAKLNRKAKKTGADLALEQDIKRTKNPLTNEPDYDARTKAMEYTAKKVKEKAPIAGVNWVERGPNNVGGRTRALMFDPNDATNKKVWAGGVAGGLWYNNDITDANSSWTKVNDFWSNLAVTCITYDPNNTQIFYVGTGEGWFNGGAVRGGGIWKTTDGGITWNLLPNTDPSTNNNFVYVNKISITSGSVLLAATRGIFTNRGGVMRSTDGGANWTKVLAPLSNIGVNDATMRDWGADIEIASNGDIYTSFGIFSQGKIYKSTDNGLTWALNLDGGVNAGRIEIAASPSNSNVLYAVCHNRGAGGSDNDALWFKKTTDGGNNWVDITIPKYITTPNTCVTSTTHFTRKQCWYDLILKVHPTNENLIVAGGIDLHRSLDGGTTWTPISFWYNVPCAPYVHADQHAILFRPNNNNEMIFGNDGGVFYSTNAGNSAVGTPHTINARNKNYNVTQFYSVGTKNEMNSTYYIAGAQDNGSIAVNGFQVKPGNELTGGDGGFAFIDQDNPNIQITSYTNNVYYLSTDGGNSFPSLINDSNTGDFINTATYDSNSNILYTNKCLANGTAPFDLYRVSGIGGVTATNTISFNPTLSNKATALKVSPHTANKLFIGTNDGNIYILDNANVAGANSNAIKITAAALAAGTISSIDIGANDNQILVTLSNYGINSIFETTDGGTNWVNKDTGSLPDMPIRWGLYNPNNRNQVVLATEAGIYTTDNFNIAPVWGTSNNGLANVRCDMLQYRAIDKTIVVATHGRGIFTSDIFVDNPLADFETSSNTACSVPQNITFTDGSLKHNNSWVWDIDNDGVTDYNIQNPTHNYTTQGLYSVKLTVANGLSTTTKTNLVNIITNAPISGCSPANNSNIGNGVGISRVNLNTIDNSTPFDDGMAKDYSCTKSTILSPNTNYTINVTLTSGVMAGTNVYIDYNNNGDFTDAGENIGTSASSNVALRTINFITPISPTFNTPLRMRVTSRSSNMPTSCNVGTFGQYEDYTVIISPNTLTWTGNTSNDWNVSTNWLPNLIPTSYNDVIIPTGVVNYPILNVNNAICKNFTLDLNANFTMNDNSILTVRGNFNANGNFMYAGTSTLQTVQNKFISFNNLTINNSNNVKLQSNIAISGTLTIQNGKLDLNGFHIDLGTTGTLSEDRANNKIIIDNSVGLNETNKGGRVRFSNRITNATLLQIAGSGIYLANAGMVTIDRYHYKGTSVGLGGGIKKIYEITGTPTNATMRIEYSTEERTTMPNNANVKLYKFDGTNWINQGGTWTSSTPDYVEASNINSFSPWTVGNSSASLPVSLVSFTALRQNENQIKLTWTTTSESNNQGFDIEKSKDGIYFEKIGFVDGLGNSTIGKIYYFIDEQQENAYYRLKQKDFSGNFTYSIIRYVEGGNENDFIIFPNPTFGNISLKLSRKVDGNSIGKIRILDANGKILKSFEGKINQAEVFLKAEVPTLSEGIYIIDINSNMGIWQQKLIKQ